MRHKRTTELRYPHLWKACLGAWSPRLGPSGGILWDSSLFRTNGSLTNFDLSTAWSVLGDGYALTFDGSNDYISLGAYQPLTTGTPFSMSAWVRLRSFSGNNYPSVMTFRSNAGNIGFGISNDTSYLGIVAGSNNATWGRFRNNLAASTWPNVWRHVGVSYIGSGPTTVASFISYLDGVPIAMVDNAAPFGSVFDLSMIGGDGGASSYMRGSLDSIMLHRRVLSLKEWRLLASRRGIAWDSIRSSRGNRLGNRRRRLLVGAGS